MTRGVPKAGFRMTRKRLQEGWNPSEGGTMTATAPSYQQTMMRPAPVEEEQFETDEEIAARINERFEILKEMAEMAISGSVRALIVSGPAGLGKSFTVEEELKKFDPFAENYTITKGYIRPTGLYKLLYKHSEEGKVLVFDDSDTIFFDDTSLNFLKAACDTTDVRRLSYLTEGQLMDDETGEEVPKHFEFNGTIIFITNYDFDAMISRGHKLAPHLEAMVSRSHYIDLTLRTRRDYMVRIRQVMDLGLLRKSGLTPSEEEEVMDFIEENQDRLRELSLRIALKVGTLRKKNPSKWQRMARATCCR
jgi:hypothetical protein